MANNLWTEAEIGFLTKHYEEKGSNYCAAALNRPVSGIRHKAQRLGLKRKGEGRKPRVVNLSGYIAVSDVNERYRVHRRIMEEHLGRKLQPDELVHHKNGDKHDNRIENLEVVSRSQHMAEHNKARPRNSKGQFAG